MASLDTLPDGVSVRLTRTDNDRPDLCPAYHDVFEVHCQVPADPVTRLHDGPHRGLGFPAVEEL